MVDGKPQPKRCKFFLWDDEAKQREKAVVLSNARSEENSKSATQTPTKTQTTLASDVGMTPSKRSKLDSTDRTLDHEDSFNWPSSEDDVFAAAESTQANSPVTPRKAAKTVQFSSPEKRSYAEISSALEDTSPSRKAAELDDVFTTPKSSTRRNGGLLSPQITPAVDRIKDGNVSKEDLVAEVLDTLSTFHLQPQIRESLIDVLNKYELRTQGIIKGREISRLAIQTKDKQISDLQARVAGLEAERETNRLGLFPKFVQISPTPAMINIINKPLPPPAREAILNQVDELYAQIVDEDNNLPENSYPPQRIIDAIDEYGINRQFLMTIGPHKRKLVTEYISRQLKPKVIIEQGSYIGYTSVFLGSLLRDIVWEGKLEKGCKVYSVEMDKTCASIARHMIRKAGLEDIVDVVEGEASSALKDLVLKGNLKMDGGEVGLVLLDHWEKFYVQDIEIMTTQLGLLRYSDDLHG
ncbi:putative o-methyltransferase family 3 [Phaeomoniella chlamydospora]|uniref:catechol O-methyltransferase n=1 Tax=Phaeomoniella chlamydospora TaxID=158046 RepID=A0A0G2DWB7_PHACM|nr:putative o-methyltransferase family 3 [Phaeomoniella chlamydospora]